EQTLHKMLKGSFMGVPTDLQALQDTPLLSSEGKQRALLDLELPPSDVQGDQSLGSFFRRRFGDELVEHETTSDRKSTRLNSSHVSISYAVFCLNEQELLPIRR